MLKCTWIAKSVFIFFGKASNNEFSSANSGVFFVICIQYGTQPTKYAVKKHVRFKRKVAKFRIIVSMEYNVRSSVRPSVRSFFLSFFLIWGDTRSIRMPALRPASQAGPMRNPREGTSVVARHHQVSLMVCVVCSCCSL